MQRPAITSEAFFSYGFRPFFLGASLWASISVMIWIVWLAWAHAGHQSVLPAAAHSPFAWHAHEMTFGFATAAIAGFLLTAVPNWTGAIPLSGRPLSILFFLWIGGRLVMLISASLHPTLVAAVDVSFLPVLAGCAARQLFLKPAARNLVFLVLVALLTLANAGFHLGSQGWAKIDPLAAARAGLLIVVIMITIIGGRIIPAFTRNWLHIRKIDSPYPLRHPTLDVASVLSVMAFVALATAEAPRGLTGGLALLAALLNGVRLIFWRGFTARGEPLVWILHLGYAWLVAGLALAALSMLASAVPLSLAMHALGTGATATMILAVMSRASLGHTGRPLRAPRLVVWSYCLVNLAALLRVLGPIAMPGNTLIVHVAAALAWIAGFVLFAIVYGPILTTERIRTVQAANPAPARQES